MSDARYAANPPFNPVHPGPDALADPGRTLGLVGMILSFFSGLVGLIISIVALRKSKAAGFRNTFAKVGIIVGSVTTALGLTLAGVGIAGAVALTSKCADLGPGVHQVGNTTITCG